MYPMECLLLSLKTVLQCWYPARSNYSVSLYLHLYFLFAGSMHAYVQILPKKDNRIKPSNYQTINLLSCLCLFETILNRKIHKHLLASNLLSDRQHGLSKGHSTGDLLAFLSDSLLSSLSIFSETFNVALDMSNGFDRVWHKSLLSKQPSCIFYPSLCTLSSSFVSDRFISAVVNG